MGKLAVKVAEVHYQSEREVIMKWLIVIVLCGAAAGCYFLRTNRLCGIDEFSNFEVKVSEHGGKPYLSVGGDRFVDSMEGVKALRQKKRARKMLLYAYTGPFWCGDNIPMHFEVDVSQLDMVYFGDVLLWTRENGIEEPFRDILRPVPMYSSEEEQEFMDAWQKSLERRKALKRKYDASK